MQPTNPKNECYTPSHILDLVHAFFPVIHLDPFSSDIANQSVKANYYISERENALTCDWANYIYPYVPVPCIWVNPPYSRNLIQQCIEKTLDFVAREECELLLLVNSSTSAKFYQACLKKHDAKCFPDKRIQFNNPYINRENGNEYSQTLFYFGARNIGFCDTFESLGSCDIVI